MILKKIENTKKYLILLFDCKFEIKIIFSLIFAWKYFVSVKHYPKNIFIVRTYFKNIDL